MIATTRAINALLMGSSRVRDPAVDARSQAGIARFQAIGGIGGRTAKRTVDEPSDRGLDYYAIITPNEASSKATLACCGPDACARRGVPRFTFMGVDYYETDPNSDENKPCQ